MRKSMLKNFLVLLLAVILSVMNYPVAASSAATATLIEKSQYTVNNGKVFVPRVTGMKDAKLQEKINSTLKTALFGLAADAAEAALAVMRKHPLGSDAAVIGTVEAGPAGRVQMETVIGGMRSVDMLSGEQLPRIC